MTVCIAARSQGQVLFAADRMITVGDIEFEPATAKIMSLTSSIAVMYSGDAALYGEIIQDLIIHVNAQVAANPEKWLEVKAVAYAYLHYWEIAKSRRAEAHILGPLGLTLDTFRSEQSAFSEQFVKTISDELITFRMPELAIIVAGVDLRHASGAFPSIYKISNQGQPAHAEIDCADQAGFVAIGIGANHAESQFMLARYNPRIPVGDAVYLMYSAKKAAEIAPGIGTDTDMFAIGPRVGENVAIGPDLMKKLETEHRKIRLKDERARQKTRKDVTLYLESLAQQPTQQQASETVENSGDTPSHT